MKAFIKRICPEFVLDSYHAIRSNISKKYSALKHKPLIEQTFRHYAEVEKRIKSRYDRPLRFASYVVYDSTFAAYRLMDLMLAKPEKYAPKIVICPDVSRGEKNLIAQYKRTKDFFIKKYGSDYVVDGYDELQDAFLDVSDQFDVIYCANPYDSMVNEVHGVRYLSQKDVLPVYMSYGFMPDWYSCKIIIPMLEISLFWKVFVDNKYSYRDYKRYELCKAKNCFLTGYPKMDVLSYFKRIETAKKRIIIAPHHTINHGLLPLSNFLQYSDFILNLPKKYPDVEFVFRPHPLLFVNLVNEGIWTKSQVDEYIANIEEAGIFYSVGGGYLDVFVNSDAMIHDCGSFIVEYLFTGKPCCFVAKKNYQKIFSTLGKACLRHHYLAFDEREICDFIEKVVMYGEDCLLSKRVEFMQKHLALNYPNASEKVLKEISF